MKNFTKKVIALSLLLIMVLTSVPVSAAYVNPNDNLSYFNAARQIDCPAISFDPMNYVVIGRTDSTEKITTKSSNPALGKIVRYKYKDGCTEVRFIAKKSGKATVTTTVGKKVFKTKVTVLKYSNPLTSMQLGKTKISGKKFNKTNKITLSYKTYAGKTFSTPKCKLKNGWERVNCYVVDTRTGKYLQDGDKIKISGGAGKKAVIVVYYNHELNRAIKHCIIFK